MYAVGEMQLQPWEMRQVGAKEGPGGAGGRRAWAAGPGGERPTRVSARRGDSRRAPPAEESRPRPAGARHAGVWFQMDEYSMCHHSAGFTVMVSMENVDSPADVSNFYGMLEVGELREPSASALPT